MNLYGASLRKGETPDDISRQAEKLTEEFIKVSQKIVKSSGADKESQIKLLKTALDNFLIFSKLPLSDSSDYK